MDGKKMNNNLFQDSVIMEDEHKEQEVFVKLPKDKFYECFTCGKVLLNAKDFKQHLKKSHIKEKSGIKCPKCGTILATERSFMIHQQLNCESDTLKCTWCNLVCIGLDNYNEHRKYHCNTNDDAPQSRLRKRNQVAKEVTIFEGPPEIIKIQKNEIEHSLLRKKGRKPKIRTVVAPRPKLDYLIGLTMLNDAKLLTNSDRQSFLNRTMKPEKCSLCVKTFNDPKSLRKHMERHSKNRPFKCNQCNYTFILKHALVYHKRIHLNLKPYKCDLCGKTFRQSSNLNRHKYVHSNDQPFQCTICKSRFKQLPYLQEHLKVHTGEKKFECNVCGKAFAHSDSLTKHRKLHSSIKAYKCDVCDCAFRQPGGLYVHKKIHTGEKPHKCRLCDKAFISASHVHRHEKTHEKVKKN